MANHNGTDIDVTKNGQTKIERYKWKMRGDRGRFAEIHKKLLNIDAKYQRTANEPKILKICSNWYWPGCGVILVARRRDGTYWVFDGQHRVLGALRRSDIEELPCMVYDLPDVSDEAAAFLIANLLRKPMTAHQSFFAAVVSGDEAALIVVRACSRVGLDIGSDPKLVRKDMPNTTRAIGMLLKIATDSGEHVLGMILQACVEICTDRPISQVLLASLHVIHQRIEDGVSPRLIQRFATVGPAELEKKAREYASMCGGGGSTSWAKGMIEIANRGLQKKFEWKPKKTERS